MKAGLYVHIPFCAGKCRYCSFNSIPYDKDLASRYIDALKTEIGRFDGDVEVAALYIGGGTPTVIPQGQLIDLVTFIKEKFRIGDQTEATFEANPGTLDGLDLARIRALGINRASLGVQSFDPDELKMLGRLHGPAEVGSSVARLRAAGFDNINLDLIYALPGQDIGGWAVNLDAAIGLKPEHISLYDLTLDEGAALYAEYRAGRLTLPPEPVQVEMYLLAVEKLEKAGYRRYEVSNFAVPGRECAHNIIYWSCGQYAGFGAGAHSYLNGVRSSNVSSVSEYVEALSIGGSPVAGEERLSVEEREREFIMLGLRKAEGIGLEEFAALFGYGLVENRGGKIRGLIEGGLVELGGGRLKLTVKGVLAYSPVVTELF